MKLTFRPPVEIGKGTLVELTTNHRESIAGVPALFVDGELVRVFVFHRPEEDSPPLISERTEDDRTESTPIIRKQRKLYQSKLRSETKQKIMRRDGYRCRYCGLDLLSSPDRYLSATVDHFTPKPYRDKPTTQADMLTCCYVCNQIKGGEYFETIEEARAFILEERAKRFEPGLAERFLRRRRERGSVARRSAAAVAASLAWLSAMFPVGTNTAT